MHGYAISPAFVAGRVSAFALIAVGVGIAGARLRRSEQRSRRLIEGLPLVMYIEDDSGLTYISPQIETLLGYSVREWVNGSGLWRRALHADDCDRVLAAYRKAVATHGDFECEY